VDEKPTFPDYENINYPKKNYLNKDSTIFGQTNKMTFNSILKDFYQRKNNLQWF